MNRTVSMTGAAIVTVTVFLFAVFILCGFPFGYYLVCMFLPVGFIMMTAGLHHECGKDTKVAANTGMALAGVYAVLVLLVYFAQTITVRTESLNDQASRILNFGRGGLIFNYDLLGYGMMALSTFFTGLAMKAENKPDRWLKGLLMVHGIFFPGCFFMPMTGMFTSMADGKAGNGGSIALLFWCLYFIPIGLLAWKHFSRRED